MTPRKILVLISLLTPLAATAATPFTALHPEAAYPDDAPLLTSADGEYADLFRQVQEKLHQQGFDAGPVNGDFGAKTQTALTQFQLSRGLPASGSLDDRTRTELGIN
jgi:peptidoglycan hydrolase-like protein with peptidoglycan-binding domain